MHGLCRKSLSQIFGEFGSHIMVSGWPLFGRTTGRSCFNRLGGLYVSSGFSRLCSFMLGSGLVSFELKSTRK